MTSKLTSVYDCMYFNLKKNGHFKSNLNEIYRYHLLLDTPFKCSEAFKKVLGSNYLGPLVAEHFTGFSYIFYFAMLGVSALHECVVMRFFKISFNSFVTF